MSLQQPFISRIICFPNSANGHLSFPCMIFAGIVVYCLHKRLLKIVYKNGIFRKRPFGFGINYLYYCYPVFPHFIINYVRIHPD